ncbi:hypothetical protein ACTL6U_03530 [Rhodovibrionaceae bacterium A322]
MTDQQISQGSPDQSGENQTTTKPEGFVDVVGQTGLNGWAWLPGHPEEKVRLEVVSDGVVVGFTTADQYREDLKNRGLGDGHHAFEWFYASAVARIDPNDITVRFAETKELLGGIEETNSTARLAIIDRKLAEMERRSKRRELVMTQLGQRFKQLETVLQSIEKNDASKPEETEEKPQAQLPVQVSAETSSSLDRLERELIELQSFIVRVESRVKNVVDQRQVTELHKALSHRPTWLVVFICMLVAAAGGAILPHYLPAGLLEQYLP